MDETNVGPLPADLLRAMGVNVTDDGVIKNQDPDDDHGPGRGGPKLTDLDRWKMQTMYLQMLTEDRPPFQAGDAIATRAELLAITDSRRRIGTFYRYLDLDNWSDRMLVRSCLENRNIAGMDGLALLASRNGVTVVPILCADFELVEVPTE